PGAGGGGPRPGRPNPGPPLPAGGAAGRGVDRARLLAWSGRRPGLWPGGMRGDLRAAGQGPYPERPAVPDAEQESAAYQRSPVDALHLAVAAAGFLLCLVLAVGAKNTMVGGEADLVQLVDRVPSALAVFLVGLVQLVAVVAPPVVLAVTPAPPRVR